MILLGLFGNPGCGRSTVAAHLQAAHGFAHVTLAPEDSGAPGFARVLRNLALLDAANTRGAVIDALACDHQAEALREAGGKVWFIARLRGLAPAGVALTPYGPDRGLLNDGTLEELRARVDLLLALTESEATA